MVRAVFLMEQHLGHQTYYENLRRFAEQAPGLHSTWFPITYAHSSLLLDKTPGLPLHLRGALQGALQVRRALRSSDYDVAFFNTQVPAALAPRQVRRRPYVLATDITPVQYDAVAHLYGHRTDDSGPVASYKRGVNISLMRGAARLLPWSSWARESLIKDYGVDPKRIEVVPPGVDLELWSPGRRGGSERLRILFVGGDLQRKGGATLLQAFRSLPPGRAELHLVTRTPVAPEAGVRTYYEMRPNSPELIALYKSSDVFALPTEAEAFGIAAVEASASGLAVVTTAVGGLTDVVDDGKTGFLVPGGDAAALRERLLHLADNPAQTLQMGRAARERAEQHFNARRNAARVISHLWDAVTAASGSATEREHS